MSLKEKAIKLALEYKDIEHDINLAGPAGRMTMIRRVAEIAHEMNDLGYPLPELIRKRQIREGL